LNAYIPLLAVGLLARYTDLFGLPTGWQWLTNGWVLAILAVLLAVEFVADKVPVVDHVNDVLQTVVRPTSGGLVFGAGVDSSGGASSVAGAEATVTDPGGFFASPDWVPIAVGVLIALGVHAAKALVRPVINATTGGLGAPVVSTAEDATSVVLSLVAIILPVLVLALLAGMVLGFGALWRRRRRRRRDRDGAHTAYY
jgi:hypothetical protein